MTMDDLNGDEIVISGISGLFPGADNMQELGDKLFNKIDMVKKLQKYPSIKHPEFPPYLGVINGTEKFDAHFFRVPSKQALCMDPVMKKLMEQTMSALVDAGINPESLKSSRLGVYVASPTVDSVAVLFTDIKGHPFIITGSSKCMLSNRISYWINGKSPSITVDQGFAGSISALEMAYNALKTNSIDCAIVGGANYCLKPELTYNLKKAGLLCMDGKTKCFDRNGDGYVRSDAVNVYVLQKAKDAKRIYSEVYHVKGKYFASPDGSFSLKRNPKDIEKFLEEFYSEVDVDPKDVEYIEANSYGIAEADGEELEAIGNIFTKENTIKVGSVKSNMGNTECTSGSCSISKLCLSYQKGELPANIHFKNPLTNIPAVNEKRIKILTENEPFQRSYTAINNFCYTGSNFHVLLKGHYIPKDSERYKSTLPRLVLISSRKEEGVNKILDNLQSNPIDPEQLALLNNIYKIYIPGYTARGYTILDTNEQNKTTSLLRGFEYYSGISRPVWFLYSGMGSQWAGMGEGLLKIPVFAAAIERCSKVLTPKGFNILEAITDRDSENMNILKSLVGITAIQIGLTDVLKSIGIVPDNMIGHSLGEICCGYADGSLTAEQAILAAYFRAVVSFETKFIKGTMAAVGLGYTDVVKLCPPEIEIACHNSSDSATISGPSNAVGLFVKSLTDRGIFAKEVASYNIAFHSKYIAEAGPKMCNLLKTVITNPKPRSSKWLSTCYLPKDWHKQHSQYASAEYFTHNLMNSVLFEESANLIPEDALIIEIAPHGLLQAIMKRSHSECVNIPLTKRNVPDSVVFLMKAIGNLYCNGLNPDLESLYPKVEFPVSTETPLLSHLIEWDHDTDWFLDLDTEEKEETLVKEFILSTFDDDLIFLQGYLQNDIHVLPEAAILVFVWETTSTFKNLDYRNTSVIFENIKLYELTTIGGEEVIKLEVSLQKKSGLFVVLHENRIIADGMINIVRKCGKGSNLLLQNQNDKYLNQNDIYSLLRTRGYTYRQDIQSIKSMNVKRNKATVKWNKNGEWINLIDSIMKTQALSDEFEGVSRVKLINTMTIDTDARKYQSLASDGDECYNVLVTKETGITECGGIIIKDMIMEEIPKTNNKLAMLNALKINNYGKENAERIKEKSSKNKTKRMTLIANGKTSFESLSWADAPILSDKMTIQVHYSGISSKDIKKHFTSENYNFGMDFSGVDINGRRVMGLVRCGAMASTVQADSDLLWPVPQHWSLADAATVPLPYAHAFYCLKIRHKLSKTNSILVVGGAGALGQAIISIALHIGCRIFATVRDADKKKFLLRLYPELEEKNIGYTYDDSFRAMVCERTNNKRCNVVINTASGVIREVAMTCVGMQILNNCFLDVNDSDYNTNELLCMGFLDGDKTYKSVNLMSVFNTNSHKKTLYSMITEGILKGYVKPLTRVIYSPSDVSRGFKLVSDKCNRGRVLVSIKDILQTPDENLAQTPSIVLYPKKAYIVVCDGTELGFELISLLIKRGAKRLIVHCRPKTITGYFHVRYASWQKQGATIEIYSDDIQLEEKCQKMVDGVKNVGFADVDGIFMVVSNGFSQNDPIFINQEKTDIVTTVSNLDKKSRNFKTLRYFAVIHAVAQGSSDNGEEKILEKMCVRRSELGLPSLFLHHVLTRTMWNSNSQNILFNGLEISLIQKYISVSTKDIPLNTKIKKNTQFDAAFTTFYRLSSKNELDVTEPIVRMKTKAASASENELILNPTDTNMILIPGFDGNSENLVTIAERLKLPAVALQMDTYKNENITEIAQKFLNLINMRFKLKSPFYLMGYSFGVNIALEIAALLEKQGLSGVVFCLDSSPDALREHLYAYLGNLTEERLQNLLIEHIFASFVGHNTEELKFRLQNVEEWTDKVELFINAAKTAKVVRSHEFMKNYLQAAYHRIKLAKEYKPNFVLQSKLVLLKGISHPDARGLTNDYNLSLYTNKPVQVFDINSDHAMALNDCRVSNYLNRIIGI